MRFDSQALNAELAAALQDRANAKKRRAWDAFNRFRHGLQLSAQRLGPDPAADVALPSLKAAYPAPPPPGDADALARLLVELVARGIPSAPVARGLIKLRFCRGTLAPEHIQRCEVRMRKIRSRYLQRRAAPRCSA